MTTSLGIIAGKGELACFLAREAKESGKTVVVVCFDKETEQAMAGMADKVHRMGLGKAQKLIDTFQNENITQLAMIGKIDKRVIFKNPFFDSKALKIMKSIKRRSDDHFMLSIVDELEKEGFKIIAQTKYLKGLMPGNGTISDREPTADEMEDVKFGMEMAKGVAALDIGQTVVVKNQAALSVEAIEGTNEAILRGGFIAGKGAVVCKVSKPKQDQRFDVPTVGVTTLENMAKCKANVLAIEAGQTVVVDIEKMKQMCDEKKIAFVAV